jgi:hypothetical protein
MVGSASFPTTAGAYHEARQSRQRDCENKLRADAAKARRKLRVDDLLFIRTRIITEPAFRAVADNLVRLRNWHLEQATPFRAGPRRRRLGRARPRRAAMSGAIARAGAGPVSPQSLSAGSAGSAGSGPSPGSSEDERRRRPTKSEGTSRSASPSCQRRYAMARRLSSYTR